MKYIDKEETAPEIKPEPEEPANNVCAECHEKLSEAMAKRSKDKYGLPLCFKHQQQAMKKQEDSNLI